jgi:hypothetical protein
MKAEMWNLYEMTGYIPPFPLLCTNLYLEVVIYLTTISVVQTT